MKVPIGCRLLFAAFLAYLATCESCWNSWVSLPHPRTSANAVQMGVNAYIIGGTKNPAYDNCREMYFNPSSPLNCDADYAYDVTPASLTQNYYPDSVGSLSKGIQGRSFAVAVNGFIYVCYACSWSLTSVQDSTLTRISVGDPGTFAEVARMPMPSPRGGASIAAFGEMLYVFGGLIGSWADNRVLVHNTSAPSGGAWRHVPSANNTPTNLCDCSVTTSHDSIFLMNCINCTSQSALSDVFRFYPGTETWAPSLSLNLTHTPQLGASNAVSMGRFAVSLWPDGYDSPHAFMLDMVSGTAMNYPVEQVLQRVRHSAALGVGSTLYFFGGNTESAYGSPPVVSNEAANIQLLPLLPLRFNSTTVQFGEPLVAFSNGNCLNDVESVRLSLTPRCDHFEGVENVPSVSCATSMSFNTTEVPKSAAQVWICLTLGSCSTESATPCGGNITTQSDCRWQGCCWTRDGRCVAPLPPSEAPELAYWYAASIDPIDLSHTTIWWQETPWYTAEWFKITAGLLGALLLYVGIIVLWRRSRVKSSRTLDSLLSSSASFGAFGKKYKLESKIGQGGFGTVFHAIRRSDKQDVAIKYIPCKDPKARDQAIKEFDFSQKLRHPNKMDCIDLIVQWSDETVPSFESYRTSSSAPTLSSSASISSPSLCETTKLLLERENKFVCIVMPFFPEGDLRRYTLRSIEQGEPLSRRTVLEVAVQMTSLLQYLHAQSPPVVHRDVKPENILLANHGTTFVLTDFGMASFHTTTNTTTRAGTLHYAAPETWKKNFSPACDVWSLGCVLYGISTGNITRENARVMFHDVDDDDFRDSITADLERLGADFAAAVLRMLVRDPSERVTAAQAHSIFQELRSCEEIATRCSIQVAE